MTVCDPLQPEAKPAMTRRQRVRFVIGLWLASLVINLLATALFTGFRELEPGSDEKDYYGEAKELLHGAGFNSIYRTPVYPAVLAVVFAATGPSVVIGKVFNCLLGGLTPVGVYVLCRALAGAFPAGESVERRARQAGMIAAVLPTLFSVNTTLYSETFSTAMFVWFSVLLVVFVPRILTRQRAGQMVWQYWLLLGMALGLLVFSKPQHVFFIPMLMLAATWLQRREPTQLVASLGAATVGFCLLMAPWWVRNWQVTDGHFIPFTTSGDRTLLDANNPTIARMNRINVVGGRKTWEGAGKFLFKIEENELVDQAQSGDRDLPGQAVQARYFRKLAVRWIVTHPVDFTVLCVKKLGYAFGVWPVWPGSLKTLALNLVFLGLLIVSIPGWVRVARLPGWHRLLLLHIAAFVSLTVVFFGSWRYRNPYEGSFVIAAVIGVSVSSRRANTLRGGPMYRSSANSEA